VTSAADLFPQHRTDFERLEKLLKLEPSEVDTQLEALLHWLEDRNYPIARPVADYLVSRGGAVVPHVREALRGRDWWWQYNIMLCLVERWPRELVVEIQPDLERLASYDLGQVEEVDIRALSLLVKHRLGDAESLQFRVARKLVGLNGLLKEVKAMEEELKRDG
jgi:hypothetical protein